MAYKTPPPSYTETVMNDVRQKNQYGSIHEQTGPAWLYHYPQQSQFSSPFGSLQYEEVDASRVFPVMSATTIHLDLGEDPVQMTCPYCHEVIVTVTQDEVGCFAYMISALLCLIGCWPCALLPCCVSDMLDVIHTCPNCKRYLDTFKRGGL